MLTHDDPQVLLFAHSHRGLGLACFHSTGNGPARRHPRDQYTRPRRILFAQEHHLAGARNNFSRRSASGVSPSRSRSEVPSSSKGRRPVVLPWPLLSCSRMTIHKCSWQIICSVTMTMTHSEKSHIRRMKAWPHKQECRGHDPTEKNLFY